LEDLDHTVKAINQEMHLKGLLDALLRDLVSHFSQADLGVFMVRHDLTGHFHVVGAHGLSRPVPAEFHLTEEEALARYTQSSEALGAGVYRVRPQAGTPGQTKIAAFGDVKSLLAMSVEIQGQLAGFLVLDNLRDPEAFRDADLAKLHRFREHVISAVNKLRTLHDLERAKELALEAARAKSHFLANMSHEIRTPMNAILGFASLGLKQDFPPKAREYFQKISNSGESLLGVINDILDFSKIEAGKLELESVSFDLPELLATTSDLFAHTAMDKGLELIVSAGIRVPRLIVGDPLRLAQVLTNLTGNALKFTEHGQVHVRVDLLDQTEGQAHLHFAVSDTGIGISPEQQALVFSAFSQADTSNTRRFGGTGLGLSISKRLVEMMGGELFVQSEFGVGSTFSFSLHLPFDPDQPPAVRQAPGDLIGLRVLVVDDNDIARTVLVEQLRAFGFEVRAVASAAAAMDVLASTTPADTFGMVLLDWRMPEMDGLEALRHIQAVTRDPKPKIILSTAFGHDELRKRAMALDVAGFLPKPLSSSRLLDGILEALGRETPTSQPLPKKPLLSGNRPYLLGARILLVEDNPINQQVASEILAGEGLRVQVAASGPEAIHAVDHGSFDAVLMDIQMPGMDGYETTALLRERSQNMDLPIIAMTAHALEGYREQCLAAGMNDYLTKPVDPEALFQVLGKWIPGRERKPPAAPLPVAAPPWPELPTSVPGFDVSGGIRRLGGKAPLFLRLVADLRRDYAQAGLQIRAALEAGDQGHAESLAHTVKGVAGNLNATELQAAAGALEQTLRAPGRGALPQALEAFDKALALTLEGCRTLDPGGSKDALFTGGPVGEAAANLLEELHRHILNHDPRAEETLEILRSHLRAPGLQPRLNLLGECLGSYEFQGALVVLADVRRGLGEPL
jgi:signal transduction histidine kinase/CheY-like chemotaxis protein